jgi:Pyruvate/2-oxoacid:ferredoxin oxidoreductase gamma subunit
MATKQIQLTGAGGQGLVLAGIILAEAAMRDGKQKAVALRTPPKYRDQNLHALEVGRRLAQENQTKEV